jgi:hypothetical protein
MKFKILNNEPLQFYDSNANLTGTIKISGSGGDLYITPESGSSRNVIIGDSTTVGDVEIGGTASPVNLRLLGGGTLTSNGNILYIGNSATSDQVIISNATFTSSLQITGSLRVSGSAYAQYFVGDGSGLTNINASASIAIRDEGTLLTSSVASIDFVGTGVSASVVGGSVTVTINGGGGSADTGSLLTTASFSNPNLTFTKGDTSTFNVNLTTLQPTTASYSLTASYALNASATVDTGSLLTTSSFNSFTSSYTTGSFTGSFFGNGSGLLGVISSSYAESASYALTSSYSISSSYATSASYALTSSYAQNIVISGSVNNVDYIDFNTGSAEPTWKSGRVYWNNTDGALSVYNAEADISLQVGQENWVRVRNATGVLITNGTAVRLIGSHGDTPKVVLAQSIQVSGSVTRDNQLLGIATHDIEINSFGYITAQGLVKGLNTSAFVDGDRLYVSSSAGKLTNIPPVAPYELIPAGIVVKAGPGGSGILYADPYQPMDFTDLSSVEIGDYTYGDIFTYIKSGSIGVWKHTNQLSGSYGITGSLTTTGSNTFIGTQIITGSSSTDLVRITQTGTGNAFIVEDSTNPDASPFVIDNAGNVGIGTTTPTQKLTISSGSILLDNTYALKIKTTSGNDADIVTLNAGNSLYLGSAQRDIYFRTGNNNIMYITSSAVGIGNSAPQSGFILDVLGKSVFRGDIYISGSLIEFGALSYKLSQGGNSWINSGSGNLGIGTSTPNAKLDVNGNTLITGSLTVTSGITGSIFGTSSWANNAVSSSYSANSKLFDGNNTAVFATTASNIFIGSQTITGSLIITNDLTVIGSSSIQYITSSQLNIATNLINVNTNTPSIRFGGIAVNDSGSSPIRSGSFLFDSQENHWLAVHENGGVVVTSSLFLMGPETYNSIGSETHPTTNRVLKSVDDEHVGDSNITDTGTTVSINSNTEITGSVLISGSLTVGGVIFGNGGMSMSGSNSVTGSLIISGSATALNVVGNATITGSLNVTQNITGSGLRITGSTSSDLVKITQNGAGNAFVVEDSTSPDSTAFTISATGNTGIGVSPDSLTKLTITNQSNVGTSYGMSSTAIGPDNGTSYAIGISGIGNNAQDNIGVTGQASAAFLGSNSNIGVYGTANGVDTSILSIGGYFSSERSIDNYSLQLIDGTEGAGKVLVSQTSDGKANWSTKLSGSYEITGSLAISGSVIGQSGNTISSDALVQASLLYLSNNF